MNKRNVTIFLIIFAIVACILVVFITKNFIGNDRNNRPNVENSQNSDTNSANGKVNEEEKPKGVVLTSKIGTEIIDFLSINDIYSNPLYKELEINGMNDKYMRTFAFIKILSEDEYQNMQRLDENYVGTYITKRDLETVVKKYFGETINITHGDIISEQYYDKENGNYVNLPVGFAGDNFECIAEIPYSIQEYSDRYDVYVYKVYVLDTYETETYPKHHIYYDVDKKNEAIVIDFDEEQGYVELRELISMNISTNKIQKEKLVKEKYTLTKVGSKYIITNCEKVSDTF